MQRENVVDDFRAGKTWVLIATDVIARGMDFKGVHCVINYDFPDSSAAYIHRIGMLHNLLILLSGDLDFLDGWNYIILCFLCVVIENKFMVSQNRAVWQSREDWRSYYFLHGR